MTSKVQVLIKNGRVIDPDNGMDAVNDIALKDGKIFAVGLNLEVTAAEEFDANGCIVTPGLIDAHVHCYEYATPLGINPDERCLSRGVTTIVDAGSAGASTFMGLRKFIIDRSRTRVKCLLHIAQHGLAASTLSSGAAGGESDTLAILDEDACQTCIDANRDVIVGVKVRLSASVCDNGNTESEAYSRALSVARKCSLPLMTHHVISSLPTQSSGSKYGCPGDLRPGDIYTHTYHSHAESIIDNMSRKVYSDVIDAKSRGVLFDVGHGAGGFNWTVAELATKQGFWPDLLGSDLHTATQNGPAYDLPTVMTKFLHLGMPLMEIIRSVTSAPAIAYGMGNLIGSFSIGKEADVTILRINDCDVMLEDTQAQVRNVKKRIVPEAVWRAGEAYPIKLPEPWPSIESRARVLHSWDGTLIKDETRPTI